MKRIGFLSLIVAGIIGCHTDRALPPGVTAEIRDGNHSNGNKFFFWLPPIINQQPPATQVFSRKLSPVVIITDQGPAGLPSPFCSPGTVIRTFSGSAVTVSDATFLVNWHTDQDPLHAECTYRITVFGGSRQLGFADVDVVNSGRELKNVITNEFIPLLDGRTLPIKFFVGVGSLCRDNVADCGEGTARPDQNTTIVTTSGRAGVFIPAGAVADNVTITIESVDDRSPTECIPNLLQQFPGTPRGADNACYEYHTDPPLRGKFNTPVTVGICPDAIAFALDHATLDLIRIFQFDAGEPSRTVPLDNVPAPFLRCDPHFSPSFGMRRSRWGDLANAFVNLVSPRPLFASTRSTMFDLGAGGSTDGFSRFTWALPITGPIDFERFPDGSAACATCALTDQFARRGVVFSFQPLVGVVPCAPFTNAQLFLSSPIYDPAGGPTNHSVTSAELPTSGFCSGTVRLSFAGAPRTVTFQLRGNNDITLYPVNAFDASGAAILGISRSNVSTFQSANGVFTGRQETVTVSNASGIARIELVMNGFIVQLDNLLITP